MEPAMLQIEDLMPADMGDVVRLLTQVQAIHVEAHPDIFQSNIPDADCRSFLEHWLNGGSINILVARHRNASVVGYLIYEIQTRDASILKKSQKYGYLHHIAVDVEHRQKGIGVKLVAEMKQRLRAAKVFQLRSEHYAFNESSSALMRSANLEPLGITVFGKV